MVAAAAVAALLVDHTRAGVAVAIVAALAVGAIAPTRPTGLPDVAAGLFSAALGRLAETIVHHTGQGWLITTVALGCAVTAMALYQRADRP